MDMNLFDKMKRIYIIPIFSSGKRLSLALFFGAIINLIYIAVNIASVIMYSSLLSATLTLYHLMLIIMRIYILSSARSSLNDRQVSRVCLRIGVLMLMLGGASAVIILYTVSLGKFVSYSGVLFLGFLVYAAYSLTSSLLNMRRHASENNYLYYAARNITLSTALMSVFNLQYSFFAYLGTDSGLASRAILMGGIFVFSMILALSIRLIKRS